MAEQQWAQKDDYSPQAWRNRVKAARLKVRFAEQLGKTPPAWVQELAREELPELQRPTRRGSAA